MKKFNLVTTFCLFSILFSGLRGYASTPTKAPLYWTPYEYCYVVSNNGMDGYIPEDVWKSNIDWMGDNLSLFGYNMISIDGWGDDFNFNENGYRTKHSSHWEHDYAWWSKYLQSKGMVLGIYNNPLWVNLQAVAQGKLIKGTNIPLSNIVDRNEPAKWFSWVQVEKEGAEEYVKGYIQYYADMGVKYLRVDFLSWFEDGIDRNPDFSVPYDRPKEYYETAIRWMKEACDVNGMTLSLVMPHLYDHAKTELKYAGGSMIRINDDICDAGWYRFSDMSKGNYHTIWPTYENAFDGFVHWSDISGFGNNKLILDGDFTRINTFRNNEEKKSAISLQLIAGGPIAVADQYNTIGNNIWLYQNLELLDLNSNGFVGKPLSRDLNNADSQIWKGQKPNGEWIIGLFNREGESQTRVIDFQKELGISQGHVRDLWEHRDLGLKQNISENLTSHGCKVYRVTPHTYQAASPVFSHRGGNYNQVLNLTLSTETNDASIYYTTDGSEPSINSMLYTKPILLTSSVIIKAIAIKNGIAYSFIVGEGYNIKPRQLNNEMYLAGSFSNWALSQNRMNYIGDNNWQSSVIPFNKGSYTFKIANSSDWSKDDWGNSAGLEGTMQKTTGGSPNATFTISQAGNYYFLFNESTLSYSIIKKSGVQTRSVIEESASKISLTSVGNNTFVIQNIKNASISVYNIQGVVVLTQKNITDNQSVILNDLTQGFYILKVDDNNNRLAQKILIK